MRNEPSYAINHRNEYVVIKTGNIWQFFSDGIRKWMCDYGHFEKRRKLDFDPLSHISGSRSLFQTALVTLDLV